MADQIDSAFMRLPIDPPWSLDRTRESWSHVRQIILKPRFPFDATWCWCPGWLSTVKDSG
jgi:hypothetical protein